MWAIIGGSGFEKFSGIKSLEDLPTETPYGQTSSGFRKIDFQGTECLFIPRHGKNHELLPTEVNYRANLYALRKHGCTRVISISAVGSLRKEIAPGELVIPHQYIDKTKGLRKSTFCGEGIVGHISLAKPIWMEGASFIESIASSFDFQIHLKKVYICIEGPSFSTQAESLYYRQMGADIIGMTHFPEYALAREAGICYLPCCFVTDYDSWDETIEHVTFAAVLEVMKQNNRKAVSIISHLLQASLPPDPQIQSLKSALLSNAELPKEKQEILSAIS